MSSMVTKDGLTDLLTEQVNPDSLTLDQMDGLQIAQLMNAADARVHLAVQAALPAIGRAIESIAYGLVNGGRLFYLGAGTSGRLGVLDASECPPTFGVPEDRVQGLIAGGETALRHAAEGAEDDGRQGRADLLAAGITYLDAVVAISASGHAAYCLEALKEAGQQKALTVAVCCNPGSPLAQAADIAIELDTGPEVLMGSTRLKAGTATKMVLNMLSTGAMVRTGRVYKNLMVDMAATNQKLAARALRMVQLATGLEAAPAAVLLQLAQGQVKTAIVMHLAGVNRTRALAALDSCGGWVARAVALLAEDVL